MKVFLSYASQDRALAAAIHRALSHQGHDVFFDREDLPPGEEFHNRIREGIERSDLFVFLISEHALDAASYTLSELEIAQKVIEQPHGRLLPVVLSPVPFAKLPAFLKSVTVLETSGDITAAVADAVHRIARLRQRRHVSLWSFALAAAALVALGVWVALPDANLPAERVGRDGAPTDLVPAGTFAMGDGEYSPRREIFLDAFYIDRFEITTARYAKFLAATGSVRPPDEWEAVAPGSASELPVIGVDWNDAAAYCAWAGRRLPTEAEWEKAARGAEARAYPWGDESPSVLRANYGNTSPEAYNGGLHKVGSHPAGRSPYGTHDMAGNVNEWVADWHADGFRSGDVRNPKGPESGKARVIRGGGRFDTAERIASARRWHGPPDLRSGDIGFRCAADAR
jgi:formylglycine-generating enzyme required for sulfatase activity